jgi:hypothetical protein
VTTTKNDQIVRQGPDDHRDKMPNPIPGHEPMWETGECTGCETAACGGHDEWLICSGCTDDYPCGEVRAFTAELKRLAKQFEGSARACKNLGFTKFSEGRADGLTMAKDELLRRATELMGEQS